MKRRLCLSLLALVLFLTLFPAPVRADMGPKPSVVIRFEGLETQRYYATLLSAQENTGPWNKEAKYMEGIGPKDIWEKFSSYSGTDGYYFLGYFEDCTDSNTFQWAYYPPDSFKILIYFPDSDRFSVSKEACEQYAFDSYFTVLHAAQNEMTVQKSYDYSGEVLSLLCRIGATIALELGIALCFGLWKKKQLLVIGLANIVTQTILNVLLNLIHYSRGSQAFVFHYVWMELAVFLIEGLIYQKWLSPSHGASQKKGIFWLYALTANIASFAAGMLIAKWVPGIF